MMLSIDVAYGLGKCRRNVFKRTNCLTGSKQRSLFSLQLRRHFSFLSATSSTVRACAASHRLLSPGFRISGYFITTLLAKASRLSRESTQSSVLLSVLRPTIFRSRIPGRIKIFTVMDQTFLRMCSTRTAHMDVRPSRLRGTRMSTQGSERLYLTSSPPRASRPWSLVWQS